MSSYILPGASVQIQYDQRKNRLSPKQIANVQIEHGLEQTIVSRLWLNQINHAEGTVHVKLLIRLYDQPQRTLDVVANVEKDHDGADILVPLHLYVQSLGQEVSSGSAQTE